MPSGLSDNKSMLGLGDDSTTGYGWMFTYNFFKFIDLLPQTTLYTHISLYETLGCMIFRASLEFKGPVNGTDEFWVQRRKEVFLEAVGLLCVVITEDGEEVNFRLSGMV